MSASAAGGTAATRTATCSTGVHVTDVECVAKTVATKIRYGVEIDTCASLAKMRKRESFFLKVAVPWRQSWRQWFRFAKVRVGSKRVWPMIVTVQLLFVGVTAACSQNAAGDACEQLSQAFPALFYSMAGFFVAFYANQSLGIYREAFAACEDLRASVVDLLKVIQSTTVDPDSDPERRKALLLECWRTANLFHVATYLLADRTRKTYSWEGFLIPVSSAFGEYDGGEKLGMLRRWEIAALSASIAE